jgi:GNAT superfamily N-acetyltransferase
MVTGTRDRDVSGAALFRLATSVDVEALTALERDTNLVALAHVFPGLPYPYDDVRERWSRLLVDPLVRVELAGPADRPDVYLAWDTPGPGRLRHLGVRPEAWGRGLARQALERAVGVRRLWVLCENTRARGFYEHLGWTPTGLEQQAEWPPYPVELEYGR